MFIDLNGMSRQKTRSQIEKRILRGGFEESLFCLLKVQSLFRSRQELGGQKTSVWLLGAELGRSEHAQSLILFSLPFTMISRTGVRSIRFLSISVMSGCSLAPSMNSSNVNSPVGVKGQPSHSDKSSCIWNDSVNQLVWRDFLLSVSWRASFFRHTVLVATATKWSTLHLCCAGANRQQTGECTCVNTRESSPSPFTSIFSKMSATISSGSISLFRVMSWMACRGRQKQAAAVSVQTKICQTSLHH